MYVRKSTRRYHGKTYTNYLLVQSIHTPKGPRQKVLCSLGDLSPRPPADWLKLAHKVECSLAGQPHLFADDDHEVSDILRMVRESRDEGQKRRSRRAPATQGTPDARLVAVDPDRIDTEEHRAAGHVHVGHEFWRKLDLDGVLAQQGLSERARQLTCAMVMNRLVHPGSEHAMPDWIRKTALSEILGVSFEGLAEDALYRNLDRLYPGRASIEAELVKKEETLFNLDRTVFFYDLTSTYFEGLALANPRAKRGYSRDKRPDCKQVVVGLVVNRDGFPMAHEVFDGNTQDRESLSEMLDVMNQRVGLAEGQTVVVDRGMAYQSNLEEIRARKLHYLVAARQPERGDWLAEFEDEEGFEPVVRIPSPRNPFQTKSTIRVKRVSRNGETYVLCQSEERTQKDLAIRTKQEQRLLQDLAKLQRRIREGRLVKEAAVGTAMGRLKERYPGVARYYRMVYEAATKSFSWHRDDEKYAAAAKLDGAYLLRTDRDDLSAEEAWRIYILLTRAEAAFRAMKSPLAERPIFHQLARRVETHIFLCVLAYHLLVAIEKTLLDKGVHTSWATIRETLKSHQVCTIVLPTSDGNVLRIRKAGTPEPSHAELYDLLDVPPHIMRPIKTWTFAEHTAEHSD